MSRVEYFSGLATIGAAYGDSTYGGNITYGQVASDDIGSGTYLAYPMPVGHPANDVWDYRVGDTEPTIRIVVVSDIADEPINPDAVWSATLVLDRISGGEHQISMPLDIGDEFTHDPEPHEFDEPGIYRAVVALVMGSGRRFTVPFDDRLTMNVYPARGGAL